MLGANIHFSGDHRKGEDILSLKSKIESTGKIVYEIPYGGSNLLGAFGFIDAVKELKSQIESRKLQIDYVFFAASSGGTQAGLQLGVDYYGLDTKLIPISIDKLGLRDKTLDEAVLELLIEGQKVLGIDKTYSINDQQIHNLKKKYCLY